MSVSFTIAQGQIFTGGTTVGTGQAGMIALTQVGSVTFGSLPPAISSIEITKDAPASTLNIDSVSIQSVTIGAVTTNAVVTLSTADLPPGTTLPPGFSLDVTGTTFDVSVLTGLGTFQGTAALYGTDGPLALVAVQSITTPFGSINAGAAVLSLGTQTTGGGLTENFTPAFSVVCYLPGTHILTPAGEVLVETLKPGDLVTTISGAHRPLRWVGFGRALVTPRNRDRATPVVVRRHALGEYVPHRDLYITRGHSLYLDGVLIPVEELVNHRSIAFVEDAKVVEYYHLETDTHDVVIAEGAAAETYREDANSPVFLNVGTRPETAPMAPYAPVLHDHPTVRRVWRRLSERAGRLDIALSEDADLHLLADGARLDAERVDGPVWRFRLDRPVADLRIASRGCIPAMIGLAQDQRRLGVALRRIELAHGDWSVALEWDCEHLAAGFHAAEPAERHRWTDGAAVLPAAFTGLLGAGATVTLHLNGTLSYPVARRDAA